MGEQQYNFNQQQNGNSQMVSFENNNELEDDDQRTFKASSTALADPAQSMEAKALTVTSVEHQSSSANLPRTVYSELSPDSIPPRPQEMSMATSSSILRGLSK